MKPTKLFMLRNKETGEYYANGRSFTNVGHLKNLKCESPL